MRMGMTLRVLLFLLFLVGVATHFLTRVDHGDPDPKIDEELAELVAATGPAGSADRSLKEEVCVRACWTVYACGFSRSDILTYDACKQLCAQNPQLAWSKCTVIAGRDFGCCGQKIGRCERLIP